MFVHYRLENCATAVSQNEQGRQCTHNVTLSHVRVILVVMKTQQCVPFALFPCICRQQCNKTLKALSWKHSHVFSVLLNYICRLRQNTHTEAPMQSFRYFCHILTNFGVSRQIFVRARNTKFHKTPTSGNRRDICGQRRTRGWTDTTNVRGALRDLNAPKNPDLISFVSSFFRKQRKTYFGLPVKCLTLLPNFNQIWIFSLDHRESLQCQIARKSGNYSRADT
jgi:hypothetical protein